MLRFLRLRLSVLLLLVAQSATAAPPGVSEPGARAQVEGKVSEYAIPNSKTPRDPVADAAGRIYFAMASGDRIVRFDPRSGQFKEWALPAGTKPHGVVVAKDGAVFFGGYGNGVIGELDSDTGSVRQYPTSSRDNRPYSLALDDRGDVWATMRAGGIAMLDRLNGKISEYPMDGSPYGVDIDSRGVLWVTCIESGHLRHFDPKTGKRGELFFGLGARPRRLVVARDGTIWMSLYGAGKVVAVDSVSKKIVSELTLPGGPNSGPYSVLADARGRVWVAEFQTDSVDILEPATRKFRTIRLPETRSGVRNAAIDSKGRYWYIGTTTGKLGVIE